MRNINQLSSRVAARIAAGEVIERPESILRELLDNALDAGADEIVIEIENGGIDRVKVSDNGKGITRDDLAVIATRHATSKIEKEDDLYNIKTLGFRGEALYSIASVTRLSITSFDRDEGSGNRIVIDNGERGIIEKAAISRGTIIEAENLFMDIPARRNFLKRPQSEAQSCRNLVLSRSLSNPAVSFKFYSDGALKLNFDKAESLKERVMMFYRPMGIADADVIHLKGHDEEFSIDIIATTSARFRSDRKEIRIYVNGRPVEEFSLTQAVTYGYGELLPGGSFPYAAVFINDNPELVDFNIHPAKREVKLRNLKDIHHAIVLLLKNGIERKIPEIKAEETPSLFNGDEKVEEMRKPFFQSQGHYSLHSDRTGEAKRGYDAVERPQDRAWIEKAKEIRIPVYYFATDVFSAPIAAISNDLRRFYIATEEGRDIVVGMGMQPEKVTISPFPLQQCVQNVRNLDKKETRRKLNLEEDVFTMQFNLGGEGLGSLEILKELRKCQEKAQVIVVGGIDDEMRKRIEAIERSLPDNVALKCVGFIKNVNEYLAASDILVGRAGINTLLEAFYARKPFLITELVYTVMSSADYVEKYKLGWNCNRNPEKQVDIIIDLIEHPGKLKEMDRNFDNIPIEFSASRLTDMILKDTEDYQKENH